MVRGGKTLTSPPRDLRAGDELYIAGEGSKLHVRLADGTSMKLLPLDGVARFSVAEESRGRGPFLGRLEHGILHASVEPRRAGAELRIESGLATALVVGTRFTLWAEKGVRTMLQVDEGVVIFRGEPGQEAVLVNARKGRYQVRAVDREPRPVEVPRDPGPDDSLDLETTGPQETIEPQRPDTLDPRPPARPSSPGIDMPYTPDRSER